MSRLQKQPLRVLTEEEQADLTGLARAWGEPAAHVARARALLAVSAGASFTAAAQAAGRKSGDGVAKLVGRFNAVGGLPLRAHPRLVPDRSGAAQTQERGGGSHRPGGGRKKKFIEEAYVVGPQLGLAVWTEDEAGPYQTAPWLKMPNAPKR
jgi:hypothetical protein